ncbi:hypothetical protein GDO78_005322 [Eleutherodactylus coqui]|uniref:Uncharacterized protein n=1 Tax=Eleutherodactylus coqui TaxID=57060 RepID=A0A8J6KEI1_ELECQ|nr:hypothetical protein GDO78_005322 [Eleutherodactylus coqui]
MAKKKKEEKKKFKKALGTDVNINTLFKGPPCLRHKLVELYNILYVFFLLFCFCRNVLDFIFYTVRSNSYETCIILEI